MKSIFRKFSFLAFIVVVSLGVLVGYGFSDFLFGGVATAPSTTIENVDSFVDPIRQNAVFNEPGDVGSVGTKYYDVYFMAQSINGGAKDTNNDGVLDNYGYYDVPDGYSNNENNIAHFGAFYGENDDGSFYDLPSNLALDTNRYFKKLENVAEVSTYQMEEIGEPKINNVYDGNSKANENESWPLEFVCWTTNYEPIYSYFTTQREWWGGTTKTYVEWPTPSTFYDGYQVWGWYPGTDDTDFSTFYTNSLLSIYDKDDDINDENNDGDAVYLINGRKSIFVYPVYSVGKDYASVRTRNEGGEGNESSVVDSLQLRKYPENATQSSTYESKMPIYDGQLTSQLQSALGGDSGSYKIFRFDNINFTDEDVNQYKYVITVDRAEPGWVGDKILITDTDSGYLLKNWSGSVDHTFEMFNEAFKFNRYSGLYNIYIVSKSYVTSDPFSNYDDALNNLKSSNNTFMDTEKIKTFFNNNSINIYDSIDCDVLVPRGITQSYRQYRYTYWDYYIVYERVYEPRLIGGTTTGGFDYSLNNDFAFTRVGATGEDKDRYVLRNVYLTSQRNVTNNETYLSNNFGIQLLEDANITYELITRDEAQNTADDWPEIITATKNDGNFAYEKYLSKSILKSGSDGLIKTADNDNNNLDGVFNLFIDVEYGDVNGVTQPTNIYVYAYQFKNLFVNLYAQTSDIKYYTGNYSDLGQTNNYVVTAACYMRIQDINQGDLLSSDMVIDKYTYNVIDAATGAVNASETGETETLGEYVSRLQSSNKCLQELTTGRYITTNTLNGNDGGFVINKNYAFIVCDMPSSLVS